MSIFGPIIQRNAYRTIGKYIGTIDQFLYETVDPHPTAVTRVHVKGVMEVKEIANGTIVPTSQPGVSIVKGGAPTVDDRLEASIFTSFGLYYLNGIDSGSTPAGYPSSPVGIMDYDYYFDLPSGQEWLNGITIALSVPGSVLWEPRDPTTEEWFKWELSGQDEVSQYLEIWFQPLTAIPNNGISKFRFSGFVDRARPSGKR